MQKNTVAALVETHVLLMMMSPVDGESGIAHKRPETESAPTLGQGRGAVNAAAGESQRPMSAVACALATPTPIIGACAELGDEQLATHELIDRLVKRLLPVLAREATCEGVTATGILSPPTLSPLHSDLQDRVKRQREVNRRLRSVLERVIV